MIALLTHGEKIRKYLFRDTNIFLIGNVTANALRLVSTIVLTRILAPADFGAVALATSLQFFFVMLSDVGFFAYIVRAADGDKRTFLDEVWTIRLIRGAVLGVIFALLAFPLANAFGKPELSWLFVASSLTFVLEGISSLAFATGAREKRILRLTILDLLPATMQIFFSVSLALLLRNYWAIMIAILASSTLKAALSYFIFPNARRKIIFSKNRTKDIWKFGRFIAASSISQIIISQSDKLFFAKVFSLNQLGLYSLASNLALLPASLTSNYSSRIIYPVFSKTFHENPSELSNLFYSIDRGFRILYLFCSGAFISTSPLIVTILYEDSYFGAAKFLEFLAIGVIFKLPVVISNDLILATGNSKHAMHISTVRVATLALCASLFIFLWGSWGVIGAVVSVEIASQIYCWIILHRMGILNVSKEISYYGMVPIGYVIGILINACGLMIIE